MRTLKVSTSIVASTLIALSGCAPLGRPVPSAPAAGAGAAALAASAAVTAAAAGGRSGPASPVLRVIDANGLDQAFDPSRFHVLEASGDVGIAGTVVGTGSVQLEDTTVIFTDSEERYFVVRRADDPAVAALIAPQSDDYGRFAVPAVFPAGTPVVATALLAQNRRLVAFGVAGGTEIAITPGSTYVTEFLRDQARTPQALATALGSQEARDLLPREAKRADDLLASGGLAAPSDGPDGDLVMGSGVRLATKYVTGVLAGDREANLAWRSVLGKPIRALTTFAGTFRRRFNDGGTASPSTETGLYQPVGVAEGADGTVYIAELGGGRLKQVKDGFISLAAGTTDGDPGVVTASLSADVSPISPQLRLGGVQEVRADQDGNLALTFADLAIKWHAVGYLCLKAGTYFGREMNANTFYRLSAPDGLLGDQDGDRTVARFRSPTGLTFDDQGNLFVADRRNNRIRRIDRATGMTSTVLGDGWPWIDAIQTASGDLPASTLTLTQAGASGSTSVTVSDFGRLLDQAEGAGAGLKASFNRPLSIAWRRAGDRQELYVYDSYNNVIRRASAAYPGSFADAAVSTVAGSTMTYNHSAEGYSVLIGKTGPATDGPAGTATLDLARYNPASRDDFQLVRSGMALDAEWGRLYIADTNNTAVRMLDLDTMTLETIASHDPDRREGDAMRAQISALPGSLAVLGNHNVLFADFINHVVREIHTRHDK